MASKIYVFWCRGRRLKCGGKDNDVGGSDRLLDCNSCDIAEVKEKRGGYLQKLYADTHASADTLGGQLIGNIRSFVEYWVPEQLQVAGPR